MKKLFIAAFALVCSSSAFAIDNEPDEGITFQTFLGVSSTEVHSIPSPFEHHGIDDFGAKVGGTAGFKIEYVLPNAHGTYINAGIDWIMKGGAIEQETTDLGTGEKYKETHKFPLHYLELPIHVGYRYNFNEKVGVYGEVGPYFGIGVGGRYKIRFDQDGSEWRDLEDSYSIFKKSDSRANFQRWDAGIGFRVGCEYMKHYSLNLGFDWGLTDMYRDSFRDKVHDAGMKLDKAKNFAFTIALGYRF